MIERISALIEKATPGPWLSRKQEWESWCVRADGEYQDLANEVDESDAAFIAHARQLLPLLLEVVKAASDYFALDQADLARERDASWVKAAEEFPLPQSLKALDAYCSEQLPTVQPIDDAGKPMNGKESR